MLLHKDSLTVHHQLCRIAVPLSNHISAHTNVHASIALPGVRDHQFATAHLEHSTVTAQEISPQGVLSEDNRFRLCSLLSPQPLMENNPHLDYLCIIQQSSIFKMMSESFWINVTLYIRVVILKWSTSTTNFYLFCATLWGKCCTFGSTTCFSQLWLLCRLIF